MLYLPDEQSSLEYEVSRVLYGNTPSRAHLLEARALRLMQKFHELFVLDISRQDIDGARHFAKVAAHARHNYRQTFETMTHDFLHVRRFEVAIPPALEVLRHDYNARLRGIPYGTLEDQQLIDLETTIQEALEILYEDGVYYTFTATATLNHVWWNGEKHVVERRAHDVRFQQQDPVSPMLPFSRDSPVDVSPYAVTNIRIQQYGISATLHHIDEIGFAVKEAYHHFKHLADLYEKNMSGGHHGFPW